MFSFGGIERGRKSQIAGLTPTAEPTTKLPDKLDVLTIHSRLIAETGGSGGLRDEGRLESALAAVENRFRYEQADAVARAATYAYHRNPDARIHRRK